MLGFSLGGNITLKYLGEAAPHPAVKAAVAISVPVDLASSARALDQRLGNRLYLRRFLATLIAKMEAKALRFPREVDVSGIRSIRSFQEFDDRYTAPIHGFRDAADYWAQSSSRQYLPRIGVPTLLLSARNDPFLTPESFPVAECGDKSLRVPGSAGCRRACRLSGSGRGHEAVVRGAFGGVPCGGGTRCWSVRVPLVTRRVFPDN